jgi:uncharacterized membrane protein required for colicin V production
MAPVLIIEIIVLLIIIICTVDGWKRGLLLKLFGLIRLVAMIALTVLLTPLIYAVLPLEPGVKEGVAVLSALVLAVVLLTVISKILHIVDHIPVLRTINRLGGALVGLIFGVLSVWVALLIISSFTDVEWCKNVTTCVRESPALTWLLHFNPVKMLL